MFWLLCSTGMRSVASQTIARQGADLASLLLAEITAPAEHLERELTLLARFCRRFGENQLAKLKHVEWTIPFPFLPSLGGLEPRRLVRLIVCEHCCKTGPRYLDLGMIGSDN